VFGRGKRVAAAAEAAREEERTALFAKLAERPDTVCPFLGLADDRTGYRDGATEAHRCYAFGDPAPLSSEQQTRVCLERGYGNCPRYLRGVLVIPTEELEALRRPRPAPPPPAAAPTRRRRRLAPVLLVALLVLAVAGGGAAAWGFLLGGFAPVAVASPEPTEAVTPTLEPSPTIAPSPTEAPTPTPDPTPQAEDEFQFYEIAVDDEDYVLYGVDDAGFVTTERQASFNRPSQARVDRIQAPNGLLHWRTVSGEYTGLSYIFPDSGDFAVREVYRRPDGGRSSELLPDEEL
jgi:hypothetical protein